MVPVIKPSGEVRICVDLKKVSENVERERYTMPALDVPELRRFQRMVQYLSRSAIVNRLNQLLQNETAWYWGPDQMKTFQTVKDRITDSRR